MITNMRKIVLAVLVLAGCEDAEPKPSPWEQQASPYGGPTGDNEEGLRERKEVCNDIGDCIAELCAGVDLEYCEDYGECWDDDQEDLVSDAMDVADSCHLNPSNYCAISRSKCGQ